MSRVYLISDLHLGHENVLKFGSRNWLGDTSLEHDHALIVNIARRCNKRDTLYILGDVCMDMERMPMLDEIPARKILVRGNHDKFDDGVYHKYFDRIFGILKYKGYWLTHCPIHPNELRGKKNIHGHVHQNFIKNNYTHERDYNYINVCVEACLGTPVLFQDIDNGVYK